MAKTDRLETQKKPGVCYALTGDGDVEYLGARV